jgi:hypothetical protein
MRHSCPGNEYGDNKPDVFSILCISRNDNMQELFGVMFTLEDASCVGC